MKIIRWAGAVALGAGLALAAAAPAAAHHNEVTVDVTTDGCTLTASSSWASDEHVVESAAVVILVDGEVHAAPVGDPLEIELPAGTTSVEWRVWGGGERDYDSPALTDLPALVAHLEAGGGELDVDAPGVAWHGLEVTGCEPEPSPNPTGEPTATPTAEPCVDVNTATADELLQLQHIDDDRAAQIIALREKQPFATADELDLVHGLKAGGPRLAELVAGGDGFLPLCEIGDEDEEVAEEVAEAGAELAQTGMPTGLLIGGGLLLGGLGGGAVWLARRRKTPTFQA